MHFMRGKRLKPVHLFRKSDNAHQCSCSRGQTTTGPPWPVTVHHTSTEHLFAPHFIGIAGYFADPKACPKSANPIADVSHNTDPKHGDVCRDVMPNWRTWDCPTDCSETNPRTKAPYCVDALNNPCRIKAPVSCAEDGGKDTGRPSTANCKLLTQ